MTTKHAYENLLRTPWELAVTLIGIIFGFLIIYRHGVFALDNNTAIYAASVFFLIAAIRAKQGIKIFLYQKRLLSLKPIPMLISKIPISKKYLFLGKGFQWLPIHRQRMHLFNNPKSQKFLQKNFLYRYIQNKAQKKANGMCSKLQKIPLFKPKSDIGGKSWIHGVEIKESSIFINQNDRSGHISVFGRTQVGKTKLTRMFHPIIKISDFSDKFRIRSHRD